MIKPRRGRGRPAVLPPEYVRVEVLLPASTIAELDRIVGGTYRRGPWIREQIEAALHRLRQGEPTCERCGAEGKRRGVLCGRCGW